MKITDIRVRIYETKTLRGFADVTLDECLVLTGIKIVESSKGLFIGMPSNVGKDGQYYDLYYPCTKEFREILTDAVLDEYDKVKDEVDKPKDRSRRPKDRSRR